MNIHEVSGFVLLPIQIRLTNSSLSEGGNEFPTGVPRKFNRVIFE